MKKRVNKNTLTDAAGAIAGAIAAQYAGAFIEKLMPTAPPGIKNAAPAILGFILAGQKSSFVKMAGVGMLATGGAKLAAAFLPGITGVDNDVFTMGLPADQSILSLPADQSILSEPDDNFETREEAAMFGVIDDED